ncbi:hypothetical protein L873DRAFT_160393 [Choiromyces venosus 120613-1]|uniref:Uncharacterized protein n=1 Tax=Choiromyces venosus 120613-1 TaxID=1336337 RepID=A0A3N4K230_9PEZI|nr:hypothetical protein L873DRAFT_160393 [Choiromyces venosus 120613-1]
MEMRGISTLLTLSSRNPFAFCEDYIHSAREVGFISFSILLLIIFHIPMMSRKVVAINCYSWKLAAPLSLSI